MLRLTLWNDAETSQFDVDLYDNAPVNLNYQFTDVTEINKTVGSYSQTFRIPATKSNTDYFGSIYDPNIKTSFGLIQGNYNIKRKIRAELTYNSVPIMKGFVQIKSMYVQKKDFADIELVFFGETVDLAKKIGDSMLSDLTTTTIDHTLNALSVIGSWLSLLASGNVRYGVMDKGENWSFADPLNPAWSSTNGVWQGQLTPYIRIKWLLDTIFSEAGLTYDSDFFDTSDVANMYLPAFNGALSVVSDNNDPEQQKCGAGLTSSFTLTSSYQTIPFVDTVTGGFDYNANWDNTANDYTAPYTGVFQFDFSFWDSGNNAQARLLHNATPIQTFALGHEQRFTVFLVAGDTITFQAKKTTAAANTLLAGAVGQGVACWVRSFYVSEPLQGQSVNVAANLPEVKQIDFLTSLQKTFNLVFAPDKNKPNHFIIEPFNDYTATGTSKDWTNKVNYNKDVVIKPTTDIQAKQYDWTNDKGQDFINVFIQNAKDRVYGRHRVTDPENDFATGEKKVQTGFAPYLVSHIPESAFVIHRCIDKDGNGIQDPKPRIAYWNNIIDDYGTWYLRNDAGTVTAQNFFPQFSNYSHYNLQYPSISDNDLNFGYERAFFWMDAHPLNTSFYKYWTNYVNELYSHESRILTAYFKLTRADIQDFEYSDKIYIKDAYYRILKINNFDATKGGEAQVELIKVLSDIEDCQFTPSSVDSAGAIRFSGGAPIEYGNQKCCERYGYIWRPRIGRCYANSQLQQPT